MSNHRIRQLKLSLRGETFYIPRICLDRAPRSRLTKMARKSSGGTGECGDTLEICMDRSPVIFSMLHHFYLDGHLHLNMNFCLSSLDEELKFWQISPGDLQPCCFDIYQRAADREEMLSRLRRDWNYAHLDEDDPTKNVTYSKSEKLQRLIWTTMSEPSSSRLAKIYSAGLIVLIIASMVLLYLDTSENFRQAPPEIWELLDNMTAYRAKTMLLMTRPIPALLVAEILTLTAITADYIIRLVLWPPPKIFVLTRGFTYITFVVLTGSWILVVAYIIHEDGEMSSLFLICHAVRAGRIFMLFRLARRYKLLIIVVLALRRSLEDLTLLVVLLFICVSFFGMLIFYIEMNHDNITDLGQGFWWALITITTVGYGDTYPVSGSGYFVACLCIIAGLLVLSFPIPIISRNFDAYSTCVHNISRMQEWKQTHRTFDDDEEQDVKSDVFVSSM